MPSNDTKCHAGVSPLFPHPGPNDCAMKLTDRLVPALTLPSGKDDVIHWDGDLKRLGYRLRRSGGNVLRSWVVRYRVGARQRRMTLDTVLSAEQARTAARKILARVELGEDPQGDKAMQRVADKHTVRGLVEEYLGDKRAELRPKTFRDTATYLTGAYFKPLHGITIDKVTRRDVAACLTRIKRERSPIVAGIARAKLSAFFVWCLRQGLAESNPTIGTDAGKRVAPRERVLSDGDLAAIWKAAVEIGGDYGAIIRLLILTGSRRAEIGGMAWSELDLDKDTWTLPRERSKNHRAHVLPVMPMMREIIDGVPRMATRDQLFGARARIGFANWGEGKARLDRRSGVSAWTVHDIRRSVATRMADIGIQPHIIEAVLNHQSGHKGGIAGIYNRSSYEREIRNALALWSDHVQALVEGGERKLLDMSSAAVAKSSRTV
jgi:integrase